MDLNIAIVDKNPTLIRAVFKPLHDKYKILYFQSLEELLKNLTPPTKDDDASSEATEEPHDYQAEPPLSPLDLLIIDNELIDKHITEWIKETQETFDILQVSPPGKLTKIIITCFEDTSMQLNTLNFPALFDVFFKPLDVQLTLQKTEMIINHPEVVSPGHLYSHKTKENVEIYKPTQLLKLSEFSMTTLNAKPLKQGSFAFFRFSLENESPSYIIGRSYSSKPADIASFYNCDFSYFSLESKKISNIRHFIQKRLQTSSKNNLSSTDNSQAEGSEEDENLSAEERALHIKLSITQRAKSGPGIHQQQKDIKKNQLTNAPKNVVVLDMDEESNETVKSLVQQNFSNVTSHHFPTYIYFLKNILKKNEEDSSQEDDENAPPPWTEPAFSFGESINLTIDHDNFELIELSPEFNDDALICGHNIQDFTEDPVHWKQLLPEDSSEQIEELFQYTISEGQSKLKFKLQNKEGASRWFKLSTKLIPGNQNHLKLTIHDISSSNSVKLKSDESLPNPEDINKVDLLIINSSFIQGDIPSWYEGLLEALRKSQLVSEFYKVPIILLTPVGKVAPPPGEATKEVFNIMYKPIDRRLLIQQIALIFDHKDEEFERTYMNSFAFNKKIEIGKSIPLARISEFGVVLKNSFPIKEGTFLTIHSNVLTNEDGSGTYARCLTSEPHPNEKNLYLVHFLYFGVQDAPLKKIRKWMREEHQAHDEEE